MTEIKFHYGLADKLGYACRLLRKVTGMGAQVVVVAQPDVLERMDAALWAFDEAAFVTHAHASGDPAVLAMSQVILATDVVQVQPRPVLVNIGSAVVPGFERFERLVELVGVEEEDRVAGRQRWKHYRDRGYALSKHDA